MKLQATEAAERYREIRDSVEPKARFTRDGVRDRRRLDSFAFGNMLWPNGPCSRKGES